MLTDEHNRNKFHNYKQFGFVSFDQSNGINQQRTKYTHEIAMSDNGGGSFVSKRHDYGEDCSSCRLVSGGGMIGISIYVLSAAKKQKTITSRYFVYCTSLGKPTGFLLLMDLLITFKSALSLSLYFLLQDCSASV